MAQEVSPGGLGPYHSRLTILPYKRSNIFDQAKPEGTYLIHLPLPDALTDSTGARWIDVDMMGVSDVVNQGGAGGGNLVERFSPAVAAAALGSLGGVAVSALGGMFGQTGAAVTNNLFPPEAVNAFFQQELGMARNPNPAVAFAGPQLRDLTLSWNLIPRNASDSQNIDNIIRVLKRAALPKVAYKDTMAVLRYPALVQFNTYPWDFGGGDNKHGWSKDSIIRYKTCAMKAVNVNYIPQSGQPAFYKGSKSYPAAVRLTVELQEVEYMLSEDWTDSGGVYGEDLPDGSNLLTDLTRQTAELVTGGLLNNLGGGNLEEFRDIAAAPIQGIIDAFGGGVPEDSNEEQTPLGDAAAALAGLGAALLTGNPAVAVTAVSSWLTGEQ